MVDLIKLAKEFPGTGQKGNNGDGKASKFRCDNEFTQGLFENLFDMSTRV
jgi:hypothetical protein